MAQLFDARGNEFQGQLDGINGLTLTDARTSTNTLNSLNASVSVDIVGKSTLFVHLNVTVQFATTTLQVQGTLDGTNFFTVPHLVVQNSNAAPAINVPETQQLTVPSGTLTGQYLLCCSATGFRQMRVIMNAFATGSAVVAVRATISDYRIIAQPFPATQGATLALLNTAAATSLMPAPGAGLFQYLTALHVSIGCTTALAAAVATPTLTLSNIPGLVFQIPTPITALGVYQLVSDKEFVAPVKATAANTVINATLSAAVAGITVRINAHWYNGA